MKTLLAVVIGALFGVALHYVFEFGLQAWVAVIGCFAAAAFFFYEYATRPGVRRGRK